MVISMKGDNNVLHSHPDDLTTEEVDRRPKGFKRKNSLTMSFPITLHNMLEDAESQGYAKIISWLPDGARFKIHDPAKFRDEIMRKYFRQTKLESFTRQVRILYTPERRKRTGSQHFVSLCQLYIYGFSKDSGFRREDMVFLHEHLQRGNIEAWKKIRRNQSGDRRVKRKGAGSKPPSPVKLLQLAIDQINPNGNPVQRKIFNDGFPWLLDTQKIDRRRVEMLQNAVHVTTDTEIGGQAFLSRSTEPLSVGNLDLKPRPIEEMLQDYNRAHKRHH